MEIREYILSGVLELYILGKLDARESAEVELMAAQHPEIRAEIAAIEQALEVYAQMHGQLPPQGTLTEILHRVDSMRPGSGKPGAGTTGKSRSSSAFLLIFVAVAALVSILAAFWAYNGKNKTEAQIAELEQRMTTLRLSCEATARTNVANEAELAFLKDAATRPIILRGTPKDTTAIAAVYVNDTQGKAYLNVVKLPTPPAGKQYQLWVLIGTAAPSDMGVFDLPAVAGTLKEIDFRPEFADKVAFAVTLEDAGGKPAPDLTQLYLISTAG